MQVASIVMIGERSEIFFGKSFQFKMFGEGDTQRANFGTVIGQRLKHQGYDLKVLSNFFYK